MKSAKTIFEIDDISQADMNKLADQFEKYLSLLEEVMIIPEEIYEEKADQIYESINIVKKLIRKLRKGDKDVFKDESEWNYFE